MLDFLQNSSSFDYPIGILQVFVPKGHIGKIPVSLQSYTRFIHESFITKEATLVLF
jgi:hypothetical protein